MGNQKQVILFDVHLVRIASCKPFSGWCWVVHLSCKSQLNACKSFTAIGNMTALLSTWRLRFLKTKSKRKNIFRFRRTCSDDGLEKTNSCNFLGSDPLRQIPLKPGIDCVDLNSRDEVLLLNLNT